MRHRLSDLLRAALCTALIAVLAQLAIPMPSSVPITLQTFAIALSGYCLRPKYGLFCMGAYLLLGLAGVPVFAGFGARRRHADRADRRVPHRLCAADPVLFAGHGMPPALAGGGAVAAWARLLPPVRHGMVLHRGPSGSHRGVFAGERALSGQGRRLARGRIPALPCARPRGCPRLLPSRRPAA